MRNRCLLVLIILTVIFMGSFVENAWAVLYADGYVYPLGHSGQPAGARVYVINAGDRLSKEYLKYGGVWPGHPGEDWNRSPGDDFNDPVYAVASGTVIDAGWYPVWGNIVQIEHTNLDGTMCWSMYAHLNIISVEKGQEIYKKTQIGTIGKGAGNRYAPHLHLEIRKVRLAADYWPRTIDDIKKNYYDPSDATTDEDPSAGYINSHRGTGLEEIGLVPSQYKPVFDIFNFFTKAAEKTEKIPTQTMNFLTNVTDIFQKALE